MSDERLPGVKTYVIGSDVPTSINALAADDFVVLGHVPDIEPYFSGCRVSIAPLRYGAGVKGKVNLAMSYGLPVVATTAVDRRHAPRPTATTCWSPTTRVRSPTPCGARTTTRRCGSGCPTAGGETSTAIFPATSRARRCASFLGHRHTPDACG